MKNPEVLEDPADFTVAEVLEFAERHPSEIARIWTSEEAGKGRSTLLSGLDDLAEKVAAAAETFRTLRRGDNDAEMGGTAVAELQAALDGVMPTGRFGGATQKALMRLQEANGLPVTGELDSVTSEHL